MRRLLILLLSSTVLCGLHVSAEINYLQLYLIGDATPAGWNENLPEEMTPIGNDCFLWDGWLGCGELKFLNVRGDWSSSIVTSSQGLEFEDGGRYDLFYRNGTDNKFINTVPGVVRIIVSLRDMKVNFRRPVLSFTGPAALGWTLDSTIPVFADNDGVVKWEGQLRQGELKILDGSGRDWAPCYNAPFEGDVLSQGGHQMVYNTSDHDSSGNFIDFKYMVPKSGRYNLEFLRGDNDRFYAVHADITAEPSLAGAFSSAPGRYLVALDRQARSVHFCPVPSRLYIGETASEAAEIANVSQGVFSSRMPLRKNTAYKLSYNPAAWEHSVISPNADTDISGGETHNLAPLDAGSYSVDADGVYVVSADFSGPHPSLQAKLVAVTSNEALPEADVTVKARAGRIEVHGAYSRVAVCNIAGILVSDTAPCSVEAGIYIVKVDNNTFKISVK